MITKELQNTAALIPARRFNQGGNPRKHGSFSAYRTDCNLKIYG